MTELASFRDVINLWPSRSALTRDLSGGPKAPVAPVRDWYARDSIPDHWFDLLISAAKRRGFDEVTYRLLAELTRSRREAGPRRASAQ